MNDLIWRKDALAVSAGEGEYTVFDRIEAIPAVDAVEVVRCRECEFWTKYDASIQGRCARYGIYPSGTWYCAAGSRREGGDDGTT